MPRHNGSDMHKAETRLALTSLAMSGERAAFSLIYEIYHQGFLKLAYRLCGDHHAAQDITQEAAITMARKITRLRNPEAFSAWGYQIIRYRTKDYFRRKKRDGHHLPLREDIALTGDDMDMDSALSLRQSLARLKPRDRQLLILFYIDGFTGVEISAATGWPVGTVKSRLFKIRTTLKQNFESKGDNNE